jgi:amino acid carrier protein
MIAVILMAPDVAAKVKEFFNTPGKYYMADVEAKKAKKK